MSLLLLLLTLTLTLPNFPLISRMRSRAEGELSAGGNDQTPTPAQDLQADPLFSVNVKRWLSFRDSRVDRYPWLLREPLRLLDHCGRRYSVKREKQVMESIH